MSQFPSLNQEDIDQLDLVLRDLLKKSGDFGEVGYIVDEYRKTWFVIRYS